MVSLWSLAVIAFERWLVICKPLGNFIFKADHALVCCAFTWVFALAASVPPLVGWSRSVSHTHSLISALVIRMQSLCAHPLLLCLPHQVHPRRPAVLLWSRLVHNQQQIQQWILRAVSLRLLLRCSLLHNLLLLLPASFYNENGEAKLREKMKTEWKDAVRPTVLSYRSLTVCRMGH